MLLVKIGGGDFDTDAVAADLASLSRPFVLVHGANKLRDKLATDLGRPPEVVESISGFTSVLSDDAAIDVLLAAYAGIRNKRIVEALRKQERPWSDWPGWRIGNRRAEPRHSGEARRPEASPP
jgi:acetylglutamate/LysW-gamma-L-alpha-aminoadipate kinase